MRYKIYLDEIALIDIFINAYILIITNRFAYNILSKKRIVCVALFMTGITVAVFLFTKNIFIKNIVSFGEYLVLPVLIFGVRKMEGYILFVKRIIFFVFLLGGSVLCVSGRNHTISIGFISIVLGGIITFVFIHLDKDKNYFAKVMIGCKDSYVRLGGIIDTGNSLVEPISGSPVTIIGRKNFEKLSIDEETRFRAIPFSGIGKSHGLLYGYQVPEITVEYKGIIKKCSNSYIAVCDEYFEDGKVEVIINPALLE